MQPPKPFHDDRPWGEELWLTRDTAAPSMVKLITVRPGEALSLQYHDRRDEYWTVISGDGRAQVGDEWTPLSKGASVFIPKGTNHRVEGGVEELTFLELTFGEFDENDIVRLEDRYGRAASE